MPSDATSGIEFNKFTRSVDFVPPAQRSKPFTIHTEPWAETDDNDQVRNLSGIQSDFVLTLVALFQRDKPSSSYLAEDTGGSRDTKLNPQDALGNSSRDVEQV